MADARVFTHHKEVIDAVQAVKAHCLNKSLSDIIDDAGQLYVDLVMEGGHDCLRQNPDYRHLVTMIDTGSHHWLNFTMSNEDKVDLFVRGAKAAAEFLCGFDWLGYKRDSQRHRGSVPGL